jgi:putative membrane protein
VIDDNEGVKPEPDYRMSLAAERTYLAYLRTGLALLAAGVAIAAALPDAGASPLRRAIGVVLTAAGGSLLGFARPRWKAITRAMRRGEPLPPALPTRYLEPALIAVAIAACIVVLIA